MRTLVNIVQSQLGWFACVLSAAAGRPSMGIALACVLLAAHLAFTEGRIRELQLLAAAGFCGALADTALVQLGVLQFPATTFVAGFTTPWMIVLWIVFATTLRHALAWLQHRLILAAVLGAVGGPLAYLAGARLGALTITQDAASYAAIGAEWALALPALLALARRGQPEDQSFGLRRMRWI